MASPRPSRSLGTVLLLLAALVLAAVLAYQAQDAARSHRATAERTLHDYASFADWQLTQHTRNGLLSTLVTALVFQASRVNPADLQHSLLSPYEVGRMARGSAGWCGCLDQVDFYFRFDWSDRTLQTTELPATVDGKMLAWVRDTIEAYARSLQPVSELGPLYFGSADSAFGALRQLRVILTNDSYAMIYGEPATHERLVAFVVSRDLAGKPVVLYGFVTDPAAFVGPVVRYVYRDRPLLPPSLIADRAADSVLAIHVADLRGHTIYRSPGSFAPAYSASDTLPANFGQLVLSVGLRPEVADLLVVGGLPRSRLPLLVALFILTAGLVVVALVQLRRQQELVRLRTEFISGVSHELRTPLAQIRWFAELLHMGKLRTDADRERSLKIIDQEARRLTYLVENVLAFSRAERRTSRISPVEVELERDVREALESFAPLARARRATLRLELEYGLRVRADRDALRQILLNLLDNAVKYGPVAQTLTVGTACVGQGDATRVQLWVDDEGPGIPESERERVWEPYVRLGRASHEATGGSGIGLAVVRELVALHGGRVRTSESPRGTGTRMLIELPALAPRAAHEAPPAPHPTPRDPRAVAAELMWVSGSFPAGVMPKGGVTRTQETPAATPIVTPTSGRTA